MSGAEYLAIYWTNWLDRDRDCRKNWVKSFNRLSSVAVSGVLQSESVHSYQLFVWLNYSQRYCWSSFGTCAYQFDYVDGSALLMLAEYTVYFQSANTACTQNSINSADRLELR